MPDAPSALTLFAQTQAHTDQKAAAIAAYRKALKVDPGYRPALIGLAHTLLMRKRYDEVIDLAIRASEKAAADAEPLELLADALMGKGALEDALEGAEAAVKLAPASAPNRVRLSVLCRKQGDYVGAMDHALRAYDLDATAKDPLNALGSALAALKHPVQARSVLTGMAAGKGLDPDVRRLVEDLVRSAGSVPAAGKDRPDADAVDADKEPRAKDANPDGSDAPKPSIPTADLLLASDDHLPNVLGLRRQDRS
jgi:tetratricopeptide (TPR) repeat protein